jgi:hypothetical protein
MVVRVSNFGPTFVLLSLAAWSFAASAGSDEAARQCAGVSDDRARLACYDGIFSKPAAADRDSAPAVPASGAARAETAVSSTPAAATAAAASSPQDDFGLSDTAKRARDPEKAKELIPQSMSEKVASVGRRPTGELVVTLDNGQVWVQIETTTMARISAGDTVTIRKAALGSYQLVSPNKVTVRVRRVK